MKPFVFALLLICANTTYAQYCENGQCRMGAARVVSQPVVRVVQPVMQVSQPVTNGILHAVGSGQQFAHCLREAQLQAQRRRSGHITGVAPGAGMQGVGMTTNLNSPTHCRGRGQLLARACVVGSDGRMYCSAAYSR